MGSVQAKSSMSSQPPRGLEKTKSENGNVNRGSVGARRSISHRVLRNGSRNKSYDPGSGGRVLTTREEPRKNSGGGGGSGGEAAGKAVGEDELVDGWPKWLTDNIPRYVLAGLVPKSADSYEKIDKVGQGTYSNVYKARDKSTGKIVALKKVRFDTSEPESVKFMAREIMILQKLDHPNIVKLEGLATSRMQYSIYLVFDYMQSDLARIITRPDERLTEPQVKCYMHQLLSGLQHCHERGILHRDIKGSNLLIDKNGMLKIADFGLGNYFNPEKKCPLTNRVVTLWYRAPELLLGATDYGIGIDLWSAGCLMAEMFTGRPIMPGRTEVEQIHRIFKLCGTPSEEYWKRSKGTKVFKPPQIYKPRLKEVFKNFTPSSSGLLHILLALDPAHRASAASALHHQFFYTSPLACDLSGLPVVYKEDDDPIQTNDRRNLRQQSRKLRDQQRKDQATEKPAASSKEEPEKSRKPTSPSQEQGSSRIRTSFSVKPTEKEQTPPPIPSSVESLPRTMSPRTESHGKAIKNIDHLPPLPSAKKSSIVNSKGYNDNIYRMNHVRRSVSTREHGKHDQRKIYKQPSLDA